MNAQDFRTVADRATTIEGRRDRRLAEVHDRITRAGRRRQFAAVAASVIAVVLALGAVTGVVALLDPDASAPPATPPTPTPTVVESPSVRKLTWATGNTIHWGERTIDVGAEVWELEATDDGVVFGGGCDHSERRGTCTSLWFTDGSDTFRIGTATGNAVRGVDIDFSAAGSTVVWSADPNEEGTDPENGAYVAYDTGARREVGRFGSAQSATLAVLDDAVYWLPDRSWCATRVRETGQCDRYQSVMRFDVATGSQVRITAAAYETYRRSGPRVFETTDNSGIGTHGLVLVNTIAFVRQGDWLVPDDHNGDTTTAKVPSTGQSVRRLRLPAGFTDVDWFPMFMWLDDDRVAVSADQEGILVCRLTSGQCRVANTGRGGLITGFRARG